MRILHTLSKVFFVAFTLTAVIASPLDAMHLQTKNQDFDVKQTKIFLKQHMDTPQNLLQAVASLLDKFQQAELIEILTESLNEENITLAQIEQRTPSKSRCCSERITNILTLLPANEYLLDERGFECRNIFLAVAHDRGEVCDLIYNQNLDHIFSSIIEIYGEKLATFLFSPFSRFFPDSPRNCNKRIY